jgi:hypothetical protein
MKLQNFWSQKVIVDVDVSCLFLLLRFAVKFHATEVAIHANLPQGRQSYKNVSTNWNQILDLSRYDTRSIKPWYPKIVIFIA